MDRETLRCSEYFDTKFEKIHVNRHFKTSCLQMSPMTRGYSVPCGPWNYLCPVVLYRTCSTPPQPPNDREDNRNSGNDKGGNEQYRFSFQAHKNKLTFVSVSNHFSKAFDCVNHEMLSNRLKRFPCIRSPHY